MNNGREANLAKGLWFLLFCWIISWTSLSLAQNVEVAAVPAPKPAVAVYPFAVVQQGSGQEAEKVSLTTYHGLVTALSKSPNIDLLDRENIIQTMRERGLIQSGIAESGAGMDLGDIPLSTYTVTGNFYYSPSKETELRLRIVQNKTGTIIGVKNYQYVDVAGDFHYEDFSRFLAERIKSFENTPAVPTKEAQAGVNLQYGIWVEEQSYTTRHPIAISGFTDYSADGDANSMLGSKISDTLIDHYVDQGFFPVLTRANMFPIFFEDKLARLGNTVSSTVHLQRQSPVVIHGRYVNSKENITVFLYIENTIASYRKSIKIIAQSEADAIDKIREQLDHYMPSVMPAPEDETAWRSADHIFLADPMVSKIFHISTPKTEGDFNKNRINIYPRIESTSMDIVDEDKIILRSALNNALAINPNHFSSFYLNNMISKKMNEEGWKIPAIEKFDTFIFSLPDSKIIMRNFPKLTKFETYEFTANDFSDMEKGQWIFEQWEAAPWECRFSALEKLYASLPVVHAIEVENRLIDKKYRTVSSTRRGSPYCAITNFPQPESTLYREKALESVPMTQTGWCMKGTACDELPSLSIQSGVLLYKTRMAEDALFSAMFVDPDNYAAAMSVALLLEQDTSNLSALSPILYREIADNGEEDRLRFLAADKIDYVKNVDFDDEFSRIIENSHYFALNSNKKIQAAKDNKSPNAEEAANIEKIMLTCRTRWRTHDEQYRDAFMYLDSVDKKPDLRHGAEGLVESMQRDCGPQYSNMIVSQKAESDFVRQLQNKMIAQVVSGEVFPEDRGIFDDDLKIRLHPEQKALLDSLIRSNAPHAGAAPLLSNATQIKELALAPVLESLNPAGSIVSVDRGAVYLDNNNLFLRGKSRSSGGGDIPVLLSETYDGSKWPAFSLPTKIAKPDFLENNNNFGFYDIRTSGDFLFVTDRAVFGSLPLVLASSAAKEKLYERGFTDSYNHLVQGKVTCQDNEKNCIDFGKPPEGFTPEEWQPIKNAMTSSVNSSGVGAVYVFKSNQAGWDFQQKLYGSDSEKMHGFGQSIAASGNQLAVCATGSDSFDGHHGGLYLFQNINDRWVETKKLLSGRCNAVGMNENWMVVALDRQIKLLQKTADGWVPASTQLDKHPNEQRPIAIAMSDTDIAITCDGDQVIEGQKVYASVFVYHLNQQQWQLTSTIYHEGVNHGFGEKLSLDDSVLLIGAPKMQHGKTLEVGAVFVYQKADDGSWSGVNKLIPNQDRRMNFGHSFAVKNKRIVIGTESDYDQRGYSAVYGYMAP